MQNYSGITEVDGGIRLTVEITDENYRHFDAFARRQGGAPAYEVAQ